MHNWISRNRYPGGIPAIADRPLIPQEEIDRFYDKLRQQVEATGYCLNPDVEFTKDLLRGLLVNRQRYGYDSCPCRLASGDKRSDLDIICPCYYRDPDLAEYGACFCALYVSRSVAGGEASAEPVPERRPPPDVRDAADRAALGITSLAYPVWRCRVCGYLCARDGPPEVCPICKASKERFERFM